MLRRFQKMIWEVLLAVLATVSTGILPANLCLVTLLVLNAPPWA